MTTLTDKLIVSTAINRYIVQRPTDSSVSQDVTIQNRDTLSLKVVLASAVVTGETRSVAELSNTGSVTGGSYPDTGATSQTLVMPAGSSVTLRFTHTMTQSPTNALSVAKRYAVATPKLSVTITERNAVDITDIGPEYFMLGTIVHGPDAYKVVKGGTTAGGLVLPNRSSAVPALVQRFFSAKGDPVRLAAICDWVENGNDLGDLVAIAQVLSALDAGLPAALDEAQATFGSLAAATTAVNATNAWVNDLRDLLASLAIR